MVYVTECLAGFQIATNNIGEGIGAGKLATEAGLPSTNLSGLPSYVPGNARHIAVIAPHGIDPDWPFSAGASWLDLNCGCPIYGMCSGSKLPDDTTLIQSWPSIARLDKLDAHVYHWK